MHNRDADGYSIRRAESPDDYRAFTDLTNEYLGSLGFEVGFQDVDLEMAEAQNRYGESGQALRCLWLTGRAQWLGSQRCVILAAVHVS